jgi:hypothetical protein
MPDMETLVTVAYQQEVPSTSAPTSLVGEVTVTDPADILVPVDGSQIAPKGLRMLAPMQLSVGTIVQVDLADNGVGDVVTLDQSFTTSRGRAWITGGQVVGTVNYATGQVALNPDGVDYQYYAWSGSAWVIRAASAA